MSSFVSFKLRYINPTRQQFHDVLSQACDLVTFGPGYVSLDEVKDGPERFVERHGPFDIIVGDEFTLLRDAVPDDKKHLHRFYYQATGFDPLLIHEGTRYYKFFKTFRGPRVLTLMASDYQGFTPDFIDQMEEIGDYFFCWGQDLITAKAAVSGEGLGDKSQNAGIYAHWNDNYYNFTRRNAHRICSLPHFVGGHEMYGGRLEQRRYDWSVMGADYDSRVDARAVLDHAGLSRTGKLHPYLFAAFQKIGFHPYNKSWAISGLNLIFQHALRSARFGFTCGGGCRWPIRKYVEIPGNGAVLAAEHCSGFEALGFLDRVNALAVDPKDILDAHVWLKSDIDRAQTMADAGRDLVAKRHSTAARSLQIAECLALIKQGHFAGSFWSEGNLRFRTLSPRSTVGTIETSASGNGEFLE